MNSTGVESESHRSEIAETVEAHLAPFFARRQVAIDAVLRKQIFFVVGSPKSGTTWVQNLLDAHPNIACRGETHFGPFLDPLARLARSFNDQKRSESVPALDRDDVLYMFASTFALILSRWGLESDSVSCVGEKSPPHAEYTSVFAEIFPGAKFVHIVRDPRDVAVSGWFHNLRKGSPQFLQQFPDLTSYARFIIESIWPGSVIGARRARESHPDLFFEFRYEDLLTQSERIVADMLRFLDVDDAPEQVRRCILEASFERRTGGRKPGAEDRASFYRRGIAGDWRNHLDHEQAAMFVDKLGPLMREFGYV